MKAAEERVPGIAGFFFFKQTFLSFTNYGRQGNKWGISGMGKGSHFLSFPGTSKGKEWNQIQDRRQQICKTNEICHSKEVKGGERWSQSAVWVSAGLGQSCRNRTLWFLWIVYGCPHSPLGWLNRCHNYWATYTTLFFHLQNNKQTVASNPRPSCPSLLSAKVGVCTTIPKFPFSYRND